MSKDLDDMDLVPLEVVPPFGPVTQHIPLDVDFAVYADGQNRGAFNETAFAVPQSTPTLLSAMSLPNALAVDPIQYGNARAIILDYAAVVELVIKNFDTGSHPFHLHGHVFQVLGGISFYTIQIISRGPLSAGTDLSIAPISSNPVRRDTVQVQNEEYVVIRFVADNPGTWLMHCHIEWHLEAGLALTFIEAPERIAKPSSNVSAVIERHCAALGRGFEGNAMGNMDGDMTGYIFEPAILWMGVPVRGWIGLLACAFSALVGSASVLWFASREISAARNTEPTA